MPKLVLIRHGTTDWNRRHLVQGHTDIPLDEAGRREVSEWQIPDDLRTFRWISSPLSRAVETAEILSGQNPGTDDRLCEMSWGEWEGRILKELREEYGDLMVAWEAKGLDFRGPGGESPREVQDRVRPMLSEMGIARTNTVAVLS